MTIIAVSSVIIGYAAMEDFIWSYLFLKKKGKMKWNCESIYFPKSLEESVPCNVVRAGNAAIRGFPKFTSQICQIWQICWIKYNKWNQHNKTNYFLQYIRNLLFLPNFIFIE